MARARSIVSTPPAWNTLNTHTMLYHGTTRSAAQQIRANLIDLSQSRNNLDFGRGFYTTTHRLQARSWAWKRFVGLSPAHRASDRPAILCFRVPLDRLGQLESLMFVRGDAAHDAFWSLVRHCRQSTAARPRSHLHPTRAAPDDWYDVVCGQLALSWPPAGRVVIPNSDQFSFHSDAGVTILNDVIKAGAPDFDIIAF